MSAATRAKGGVLGLDVALFSSEVRQSRRGARLCYVICSRAGGAHDIATMLGEESRIEIIEAAPGGPALSLRLIRSISSRHELFFAINEGRVVVSDRFAYVARALPPALRAPCDAAVVDHFMFRAPTPPLTYCRGAARAPSGGVVEINLHSGEVRRFQKQRVPALVAADPGGDDVAHVGVALARSLADAPHADTAVLFSGGVDSSLIAAMTPTLPLLQCVIDSPEFAREGACARRAADALGRTLTTMTLGEDVYRDQLIDLTDRIGAPPHHAVTVAIDHAMSSPHGAYIAGTEADVLFGFGAGRDLRIAAGATGNLARGALAAAAALASGRRKRRFQTLATMAGMMARQVGSPWGYALGMSQPALLPAMMAMFGSAAVERRLAARLEYVRGLGLAVDCASHDPSHHVAVRQMINYFCSNTTGVWRQVALSRGKALFCPFVDARVLQTALSIPEDRRYRRGDEVKHILKDCLERLAPAYERRQPKLGGEVPILRYARSGSLRGVFDSFPPPDFLSPAEGMRIAERYPRLLWHMVSFSVWRGRAGAWDGVAAGPAPRRRYVATAKGAPDRVAL